MDKSDSTEDYVFVFLNAISFTTQAHIEKVKINCEYNHYKINSEDLICLRASQIFKQKESITISKVGAGMIAQW